MQISKLMSQNSVVLEILPPSFACHIFSVLFIVKGKLSYFFIHFSFFNLFKRKDKKTTILDFLILLIPHSEKKNTFHLVPYVSY